MDSVSRHYKSRAKSAVNVSKRCIAEVQASEVGGSDQTVCDTKGTEDTYPIVGIDEANVQERRTIWISPLARAPEKTRKGDTVHFDSPGGLRELDIVQFRYE